MCEWDEINNEIEIVLILSLQGNAVLRLLDVSIKPHTCVVSYTSTILFLGETFVVTVS